MFFAIKDGQQIPATVSGEIARCPLCDTDVYARVGPERVPHWAHKIKSECDPWVEEVSFWHQDWYKDFLDNGFKVEEKITKGDEYHSASVFTPNENIIQLRTSPISSNIRQAYASFFDSLTWLVEVHQQNHLDNFLKKINSAHVIPAQNLLVDGQQNVNSIFWIYRADQIFPRSWCKLNVPVIFDLSKLDPLPNTVKEDRRYLYWYLIPGCYEDFSMVRVFDRKGLINNLKKRKKTSNKEMESALVNYIKSHSEIEKKLWSKSFSFY